MICRWITGITTLLCFLSAHTFEEESPKLGSEVEHVSVQKRFLLVNSGAANVSLEQFASCFLTCTPGYEKLTGACCLSGAGVVCANLPWDMLKPILGKCPGLSISPLPTAWISLEQFAACSLNCVVGYEKLTAACCQTGLDVVCSNLPWNMLKLYLGTCQDTSVSSTVAATSKMTSTDMTSHSMTLPQTTSPVTTSTKTPQPYWLPWGKWSCENLDGNCFQKRSRNCSTGGNNACISNLGGIYYDIAFCTILTCPEYFLSTVPTTIQTAQQVPCEDDPSSVGCKDIVLLTEVCRVKQTAWSLCRKSCGLCDTCWDYLNCSSQDARDLFCSNDNYAVHFCRKTCGKCDYKPVDVRVNKCGDPVASEDICELLQTETCICNDQEIRSLCENYCNNKCLGHPYNGSNCVPSRRKKREAILNGLIMI